MSRSSRAARVTPYARELLENPYVQENLRDGAGKLRAAYGRMQKRRVEPTRDERLRRQVVSAAQSLGEAARAVRTGRRGPERRWPKRLAVIGGLGAAGTVTAVWAKQRLAETPTETEAPSQSATPTEQPTAVAA
jgi:hypothetical protein